jgi:two-component system, cell cycle response regulator
MDERNSISIFFVDDEPNFLDSVKRSMRTQGFASPMKFFTSAESALKALNTEEAVIVTDWMMEGMNGPDFCRSIRDAEHRGLTNYHYLILLTGRQERGIAAQGLQSGADEFLNKPFDPEELVARLRVGLRIVDLQRRLRIANQKLIELATTDLLTGAYNRRHGLEVIERERERVSRGKEDLSLLLLDLDKYKKVNDTYGHAAGDSVLKEVVRQITQSCRKYDIVVRWGGDEILVVCPYASQKIAAGIANRICRAVEALVIPVAPDTCISVTTSIGVYTAVSGSSNPCAAMLENADKAVYRVKGRGGNGYQTNSYELQSSASAAL